MSPCSRSSPHAWNATGAHRFSAARRRKSTCSYATGGHASRRGRCTRAWMVRALHRAPVRRDGAPRHAGHRGRRARRGRRPGWRVNSGRQGAHRATDRVKLHARRKRSACCTPAEEDREATGGRRRHFDGCRSLLMEDVTVGCDWARPN